MRVQLLNIKVSLSQNPKNGTWAKEVTLTGKAEAKEDEEIKIQENGEYYFCVTDGTNNKEKTYKSNKVEVTNIDRIDPTAGKLLDKDNIEFSKENTVYSKEDTLIKKVEGIGTEHTKASTTQETCDTCEGTGSVTVTTTCEHGRTSKHND